MTKHKKDNIYANLPVEAAEFIQLLVKKIRYRKKIREDVAAELVGHFEDALRDIQDEEQKKQVCQNIIEEFGDSKFLATLVRRAKKRCRPMWKKAMIKCFQAIGIVFLVLVIYIAWFLSGKPVITTNYIEVMSEVTKPYADVDPNFNAEPYYKQAYEIIEQMKDESDQWFDVFGDTPAEVNDVELIVIESKLAEIEDILNLVKAGTEKPYYWINYGTGKDSASTEAIAVLMPGLAALRDVSRALCWRARIGFSAGDYKVAADDLIAAYRLGKHLKGDKTLIEQLVGIAIEAISVQTVIELAGDVNAPTEFIVQLKQQLQNEVCNDDFTASIEQERIFMLDEIQRSFTESRIFGSHLYLKRIGGILLMVGSNEDKTYFYEDIVNILFTHPDKQKTLASVNRFYDQMDRYSENSPFTNRQRGLNIDDEFTKDYANNLFIKLLAPALGKVSQISWRNKIQVQATVAVLSVFEYRNKFGKLPESLGEVVGAGLLKEIPIDPFSNKPVIYKRTGEDFTLYSVGYNFIDDGGVWGTVSSGGCNGKIDYRKKVWADDGDAIFWPMIEK